VEDREQAGEPTFDDLFEDDISVNQTGLGPCSLDVVDFHSECRS
jgi:hypothetical protein